MLHTVGVACAHVCPCFCLLVALLHKPLLSLFVWICCSHLSECPYVACFVFCVGLVFAPVRVFRLIFVASTRLDCCLVICSCFDTLMLFMLCEASALSFVCSLLFFVFSYCPGGPDSDFEYSTQAYTGYEPTCNSLKK